MGAAFGWTYNWSNTGLSENGGYAMFSSERNSSNIIYTYDEIVEKIATQKSVTVPIGVLQAAIEGLQNQQAKVA